MSFFDVYWTVVNNHPMDNGRPATRYKIWCECIRAWKENQL
jgi:hypothetical protein